MKKLSENDLALLFRALAFAAHKHRDQRRKDAEASPYINHPIALAQVLTGEGGVTDIEVLAAALLHDTIEDTATTGEELEREFGGRIAAIVAEVTDDTGLPKAERKRLQIEHAARLSDGAIEAPHLHRVIPMRFHSTGIHTFLGEIGYVLVRSDI